MPTTHTPSAGDAAERYGSITWRGRYLERIVALASHLETRRARHWSDWWIHGVVPLALLHLLLYLSLEARLGPFALTLWRWGPACLIVIAAGLLLCALASATFSHRVWSWHRALALGGLCGIVLTLGGSRTFPSVHDAAPSDIGLRLPLDGPVTVAWGGPTATVNYHVSSPPEKWGYDLLVTVDGRSHRGTGDRLEDYYAYGRPVLAPADGQVVERHDGIPDEPPHRPNRHAGGGNRLLIEVGPAQYLLVAHLQAGSLRAVEGQRIRRGDVLGLVGNSGNSSEPHVHLHLQDARALETSQGIPVSFADYRTAEGAKVERGMPEGGVRQGRYVGSIVLALEHPTAR